MKLNHYVVPKILKYCDPESLMVLKSIFPLFVNQEIKGRIEPLISKIVRGVQSRKENYKTDAYFDLPENFTIDNIKLLQQIIEADPALQVRCRLYSRCRLQVYWDYCPRRNVIEFLSGLPAIHDVDEQMKLFDLVAQEDHADKA